MTSTAKAAGRFGKQDFIYDAADDIYRCPVGERLTHRYTREEDGKMLRRYWSSNCGGVSTESHDCPCASPGPMNSPSMPGTAAMASMLSSPAWLSICPTMQISSCARA